MKIKAIITGSTGMVGKGVLLECLEDENVESILVINRHPIGMSHPKLKEVIHNDFFDLTKIKSELEGYNTCYFCLGVSALGLSNESYYKLTYELTVNFAATLAGMNPKMTFCYVSGEGTDSQEKSRANWSNVKGKTENKLLTLPFKKVYLFRPGFIQPLKGIKSRTKIYNIIYVLFYPLIPVWKALFPKNITTTVRVGIAMIRVVKNNYPHTYLHNKEINELAQI